MLCVCDSVCVCVWWGGICVVTQLHQNSKLLLMVSEEISDISGWLGMGGEGFESQSFIGRLHQSFPTASRESNLSCSSTKFFHS